MVMRLTSTLTSLFLVLNSVSGCASTHALPSRSQCIVEIISHAPNKTQFTNRGVMGLVVTAQEINIPLAGLAVTGSRTLYLQFGARCDRRFAMAERLLLQRFSTGDFSIRRSTVIPGPGTINVFGKSWSDGKLQLPPPIQPSQMKDAPPVLDSLSTKRH